LTLSKNNITLTNMTKRQIKGRPRKYDDDPMVPIMPANLRAAVEFWGDDVGALARRLGGNRQTLHHLMIGEEPKRCRRSRRQRLAQVLGVSSRWLAGEGMRLPFVPASDLSERWDASPRVALAIGTLIDRCGDACRRDLARFQTDPANDAPRLLLDVVENVLGSMYRLVDSLAWSNELTIDAPGTRRQLTPEERELRAAIDAQWALEHGGADEATRHKAGVRTALLVRRIRARPLHKEHEDAAIALVRAFTLILDPWLRGAMDLRYDRLAAIIRVFMPGAEIVMPYTERPVAIVMPTGERVEPADPRTPFVVLRWYPTAPAALTKKPKQPPPKKGKRHAR